MLKIRHALTLFYLRSQTTLKNFFVFNPN
ncbi:hypothetical protein PSEUDO8BK_40812 [Pseudomonas sp. 8BK]|nr:hypothetical protein PSEUDO8BK_40812 [Pseudomonas sp. 8BK]